MISAPRSRDAFSLVEVIVAVGIVAFALVAMLALIGSLLGNARETATQNEALQLVPSLNDYLQKRGFSNVYGWVATPASQPVILAFNRETNAHIERVITNVANASQAPQEAETRVGRLFRVTLSFSTNNPSGLATLPAMGSYTNFALPLRVNLHSTPNASVVPASNNQVFSYETAVFR